MCDKDCVIGSIYVERQKFRQWWRWVLVLIGPISVLGILLRQTLAGGMIEGIVTNSTITVFGVFMIGLVFPLMLFIMRLDTEVNQTELRIRFSPFHRKWVTFGFDRINKVEPLTYSPLKDFGGWGIRYGKKGKAYNVSGNKGILLTFYEGKSIVIGSQNHVILATKVDSRLP